MDMSLDRTEKIVIVAAGVAVIGLAAVSLLYGDSSTASAAMSSGAGGGMAGGSTAGALGSLVGGGMGGMP